MIVDVAEAPAFVETLAGLAAMLKSTTLTVTFAEWVTEPAVPVTVTKKVPTFKPLHANTALVEVPTVTLTGLSEQAGPPLGVTDMARPTLPVKPLTAAIVMVDVPVDPTFIVMLVGLVVMLKSTMSTLKDTVWTSEPLVPVTVTV